MGRLLRRREPVRFGVWNIRTLRGFGKTEQLALAMKQYRLSCVAVTETHLTATFQTHMISPLSGKTSTFVKDSGDFVKKARSKRLKEGCILGSFDM